MKKIIMDVKDRYEAPAEELSQYVSENFGGNLLTLRQLEPYIREIQRRFIILPRNRGVDGQFKTISGCRSFKLWCSNNLGRTDRTVRYMLAKAKNEPKRKTTETISAVEKVVRYIRKQKLTDEQIDQVVNQYKG